MASSHQRTALGAEVKIKRAKGHFSELDGLIDAFKKSIKPPVKKENPKLRQREYTFTETRDIGDDIPLRIGEVLQNLRSALDYIVCALILSNGGELTRYSGFPIALDADEYKRTRVRHIQGMRQEAMDAIDATKPYKCNGTRTLWVLRRLNDRDKHRLLVAAAIGYNVTRIQLRPRSFIVGMGRMQTLGSSLWNVDVTPTDRMFPLKNGHVFFTQPIDVTEEPKFAFDVAFNEPGVIEGEPVLPAVNELMQLVPSIVKSLSAFLV
jgi:hypothetical protein